MTEKAIGTQVPNPYNAPAPIEEAPRGILNANDQLGTPRQPEVAQVPVVAVEEPIVPDVPVEEPVAQFKKVDYKKRYDDLKRHYDLKLNEFKAKESKMSQKIKDGLPNYTPPRTPDELATFKEEFPEVYDTIETIAHSKSEERANKLDERLAAIEEREAVVTKTEAFSKLEKLQPEFAEIKATQEFHKWVDNQPQDIQDWLYKSFNADLASRAIDLFKQDVGWKTAKAEDKPKTKPKPKKKPSAADMVDVSTKSEPTAQEQKIWTVKEINNLARQAPQELERLMPEIEKAQREGRVI